MQSIFRKLKGFFEKETEGCVDQQQTRLYMDELLAAGFTPWEYRCPPPDTLVECVRGTTRESFEVVPSKLSPYFNVANLFWREPRPMKTIEVEARFET